MSVLARRVATRFVLARSSFGPDIELVRDLVSRNDYPAALNALEKFMNLKLRAQVTRSSDQVHIRTEWASNLEPDDMRRFKKVLDLLMRARNELRRPSPEGMRIENPLDELLSDHVTWLDETSRDVDDEFAHGPFKIILTKGAEHGIEEAIKTLDAAASKIGPKFPKVLYGKVYVRKGLRSSDGTFEPSPSARQQIAGSYAHATDTINLSLYAVPDRNSVHTLIHEFGHRYHTRVLSGKQRERFIELSTVGDRHVTHFDLAERRQIAAEYMALLREHQKENYPDSDTVLSARTRLWVAAYDRDLWRKDVVPLTQLFRDERDDSVADKLEYALGQYQYGGNLETITNEGKYSPLAASAYGATSWQENFAESFLAFVTGKALPEALQTFMEAL